MTTQEQVNNFISRRVRVIGSTYYPNDKTRAMIGQELDIKAIYLYAGNVSVYAQNKSDYWSFGLSDVRFLTHVEYEGRHIAVGDRVKWNDKWHTVTNEYLYDDNWYLATHNDTFGNYVDITVENITAHDYGLPSKDKEAWLKEGRKQGWIKDGEVIK